MSCHALIGRNAAMSYPVRCLTARCFSLEVCLVASWCDEFVALLIRIEFYSYIIFSPFSLNDVGDRRFSNSDLNSADSYLCTRIICSSLKCRKYFCV
jgi:hypothetical protein